MAQVVIPGMKAAGFGRIVTISSGARIGVSLTGIQFAYAAAKAGEIGLTRQLAHELGPFGITVNSVAPGFIRSNPTTEQRQWEAYAAEGAEAPARGYCAAALRLPVADGHPCFAPVLCERAGRLDQRANSQCGWWKMSDTSALAWAEDRQWPGY